MRSRIHTFIPKYAEEPESSGIFNFYIVSIEDAKEQLETAKEVVVLVEQYLKILDE